MRVSIGLAAIPVFFSLSCATMVPQGQPIEGTPTDYEFNVEAPRPEVFQAFLSVAQQLNLNVDVLDRESGFIQFKNSALSPSQLDDFCVYPVVKPGSEQAWDTFTGWNQRSLRAGGGSVSGTVSLNVLLTEPEESPGVQANLHSTWVASNGRETHQLNSKGVLEQRIKQAVRARLGLSSRATPSDEGARTQGSTRRRAPNHATAPDGWRRR